MNQTPDHPDLMRIESKIDANTRSTQEILETLRGPLKNPGEGLVSRVERIEHDVRSIKRTHRTVKGWAFAAIGGTLLIAAKSGWALLTTGKIPEHLP